MLSKLDRLRGSVIGSDRTMRLQLVLAVGADLVDVEVTQLLDEWSMG